MQTAFSRVYTVTDYDDGPRSGIADYDGTPHLYVSLWTHDFSEYDGRLVLSPVQPAVFRLAIEDWEIWRRWEDAYHDSQTTIDTHPALPADQVRSVQLKALLADLLVLNPQSWFVAIGTFRREPSVQWSGRGLGSLEVCWERCDESVDESRLVVRGRGKLHS